MVLTLKTKKMEPSSLEQFKWMVDTQYPTIKKYIISEDENRIILEDPNGESMISTNSDISALFEWPCPFPFKGISVSHSEKNSCYTIRAELK